MGLKSRILSIFKSKQEEEDLSSKSQQEEEYFLQNGGELLAKLIAITNGRYDVPIRSFTADELSRATKTSALVEMFRGVPIRSFSGDELSSATDTSALPVSRKNEVEMLRGDLDGRPVLIKVWSNKSVDTSMHLNNIAIGSQMSHLKNVLKLVGCCLQVEYPISVYEYVEGTPLDQLLDPDNNDRLLSLRRRISIASDIARAILYLHTAFQTPIIHRDLKPNWVIIDQHGVAKLIDFSLSIALPPGELRVEDIVHGTLGFLDPEYFSSQYVTQKSDVYSFGVLLLTLITGKRVYGLPDGDRNISLVEFVSRYVDNHQYDQIIDPRIREEVQQVGSENRLESFVDLALMCTQLNGEDRPEMIDVAKHLRLIQKSFS